MSTRGVGSGRSAEHLRLAEDARGERTWKQWGPYLSERQWGTVREDYSPHGNAWEYLPHDVARSRACRWGEDGIAGMSDDRQLLCLAVALWNGEDPILKERLFGLTNSEGNHGEDVKELYYYLDATPTKPYLKMRYKYPQCRFPYTRLVEEHRRRGNDHHPEFELIDTGIFDERPYFDVFVEYAKAAPNDVLLTPMGLRSLAPDNPAYVPHHQGSARDRDAAYHQGTVWPWLIGPFAEAWVRVRGNTASAIREARTRFLTQLLWHLDEAGLGHISEIADGDPPHTPRGCPFQAWSLGEALRLDLEVLAE